MQSDRAVLQELIDEQVEAAANAGAVASRLGPEMGAMFAAVEKTLMRRAIVLASLIPNADDTAPQPPRPRPMLAFAREP